MDIKGDRLRHIVHDASSLHKGNVLAIRDIIEHLDEYFAPGEIDSLWIIHPDPQPATGDAKKRLTHPRFLTMYESLLSPHGVLHLKTDDPAFFTFSLEMLAERRRTITDQT